MCALASKPRQGQYPILFNRMKANYISVSNVCIENCIISGGKKRPRVQEEANLRMEKMKKARTESNHESNRKIFSNLRDTILFGYAHARVERTLNKPAFYDIEKNGLFFCGCTKYIVFPYLSRYGMT